MESKLCAGIVQTSVSTSPFFSIPKLSEHQEPWLLYTRACFVVLSLLPAYKNILSLYVVALLCLFAKPLFYTKLMLHESKIIKMRSLGSLWSCSMTKENFVAALTGMFMSCFREPLRSSKAHNGDIFHVPPSDALVTKSGFNSAGLFKRWQSER